MKEALKQRPDKTCAIMLDTKGPEIRTGKLKDGKPIELTMGQDLEIVTDYDIEGDTTRIACSYKSLPDSVQVGSTIYIADGSLTCEVTDIMEVRKILFSQDMKLKDTKMSMKSLTQKFESSLLFCTFLFWLLKF